MRPHIRSVMLNTLQVALQRSDLTFRNGSTLWSCEAVAQRQPGMIWFWTLYAAASIVLSGEIESPRARSAIWMLFYPSKYRRSHVLSEPSRLQMSASGHLERIPCSLQRRDAVASVSACPGRYPTPVSSRQMSPFTWIPLYHRWYVSALWFMPTVLLLLQRVI